VLPTPLPIADEVIEQENFAAMRMSPFGTKRTERDVCYFVRFWGEADMHSHVTWITLAVDAPEADIEVYVLAPSRILMPIGTMRITAGGRR
jgi:hypothetical protein